MNLEGVEKMKIKMKTKKKMKTKTKTTEKESDPKAQLVMDICSISLAPASCTHRRTRRSTPGKQDFIDWYLVLKVDEDEGVEVIRRRYRQLALQLHPDKNRHPKAEVAFKIVSEAYCCLSDEARRQAFNSERLHKLCKECRAKKAQQSLHNKNQQKYTSHYNAAATTTTKEPPPSPPPPQPQAARWRRNLIVLREVQKRLHEECRVVERCLQANQGSRSEGFPLFNPSNPTVYPDYPHRRTRASLIPPEYNNCFTSRDMRNYCFGRKLYESPVYELRPDRR